MICSRLLSLSADYTAKAYHKLDRIDSDDENEPALVGGGRGRGGRGPRVTARGARGARGAGRQAEQLLHPHQLLLC